jgi:hypothetical protein
MSGLTVSQKTALRDAYYAAELAIIGGAQSYTVDGITFVKADLGKVQAMREKLDREISAASKSPVNFVTFGRP